MAFPTGTSHDFSFQAWVRDFEQLIDTIQLDKFALLGISQGGAVAVSYAARHPERVSKLILYGAFSRGWMLRNTPGEIERRNALLTSGPLGLGQRQPGIPAIVDNAVYADRRHPNSLTGSTSCNV